MSTERRWVPNVGGRDTHFDKSNVQLVPYEEEEAASVDTEENEFSKMNPRACMQVGRVDIRLHYLDYRPPFSTFLAFAIALAQSDPLASYQN